MKNIKIIFLMIFLMGYFTAFSQQVSTGLQDGQQKTTSVKQDRSTLSPNPAPGELTGLQDLGDSNGEQQLLPDATEIADPESSPNKPTDPATLTVKGSGEMVTTTVENVGPRPSDPNGIRPETK